MLNENKEYEQYTTHYALNTPGMERLRYTNIVNGLSGLERAMSVVARHFIYDEMKSRDNTDEVIRCTTACLQSWLGLQRKKLYFVYAPDKNGQPRWQKSNPEAYEEKKIDSAHEIVLKQDCIGTEIHVENPDELIESQEAIVDILTRIYPQYCYCESCPKEKQAQEIKRIHNCLPDYLEALKKQKENDEDKTGAGKLETTLTALKKRNYLFCRRLMVSFTAADQENDEKSITYEKIIANALHSGALKEKVLTAQISKKEKHYATEKNKNSDECFIVDIDGYTAEACETDKKTLLSSFSCAEKEKEINGYFNSVGKKVQNAHAGGRPAYIRKRLAEILPDELAEQIDRKVLRCSSELLSRVYTEGKDLGSLSKREQKVVLSVTAYILSQAKDGEYVVFNRTDFSNWLNVKIKSDKSKKSLIDFSQYLYLPLPEGAAKTSEPEHLFDTYVVDDKCNKVRVNSKWVEQYSVKVRDVGRNVHASKGKILVEYVDNGKGCELCEY